MFEGFTQETTDFLWGILLNNEREWFLAHKARYQTALYNPLKELAAEVQAGILEKFPDHQLNLKVTRIYRDTRIPRPDGPYKTALWFSLRAPGKEWTTCPCLYFEISGSGYETGMDFYVREPAVMQAFRDSILADPKPLRKLARRLNDNPAFTLNGAEYKRSKGTVEPLLQPWFNRKSICISHSRMNDEGLLYSPELVGEIVSDYEWLMPFYDFFA